jgi:hypothetical protein
MSMLVVFFFSWLPLNTINLAEDLGKHTTTDIFNWNQDISTTKFFIHLSLKFASI